MSSKQVNGAKKVLTAAALTYVAAALTSIIQLLYLRARYNRNSNRSQIGSLGAAVICVPAALYYVLDLNLRRAEASVHDDERRLRGWLESNRQCCFRRV